MNTVYVPIRVPEELARKIEERSRLERRSRSWVIVEVLRKEFEPEEDAILEVPE